MTKRTRTLLFLLLGALFFVLAPTIILYSQGYRFDWESKWFSQIGAFYFNITPPRAEVFVNEKTIGKTAYILGTTLSKNFSPGLYSIRVTKDGYHPWQKLLEVFPKQVTEAKHIILFEQNPAFTTLKDNVQAFWFAPNNIEVLMQKTSPSGGRNTLTLVLWNTKENTEYPLYESQRLQDEIQSVQWDLDSNSFILRIASQEQVQRFIQRIDRNLLARQTSRAQSLQTASQLRTVYTLNPLAQGAVAHLETGPEMLWFDQKGILWHQTSQSAKAVQVNQTPFPVRTETAYTIHAPGSELFLQENQTLYILNPQTQAFDEFFAPFSEIVLSPDAHKIALSSGNEIWLYFFEEEREQPSRSKGEKVFLTRFSEDIGNLGWFDSHHLLFTRGEAIVVSEIDNRDHLNMVELAKFSNPSIFWQNAAKTLFVHTKDQILSSEKLLP